MKSFLFVVFFFCLGVCYSQKADSLSYKESNPHYLGVGAGMDYGGLGLKLEISPTPFLGVFASVGNNLDKYVLNGGIMLKPNSNTTVMPYFLAMYGYNGVLVVKGADEYNRTFYGFTVGFGLSITTKKLNKWVIGLNIPIRNNEFSDYFEELNENPQIKFNGPPLPVAFTIGYNIRLN
jgi:hypothetical protein